MGWLEILLLALVVLWLAATLLWLYRRKKRGQGLCTGCCAECMCRCTRNNRNAEPCDRGCETDKSKNADKYDKTTG